MRKKDVVHLHDLRIEVTQFLANQEVVSADIRNEHEASGITAYSIHAQKSDHQEAVLVLATTLSAALTQPTDEQSTISVPSQ